MVRTQRLPDADRLSVLAATILLAYLSTRFVNLPPHELSLQLPGLYFAMDVNIRTIVSLLVAGLTATGADWLLRDHPAMAGRSTFQHWLLPALTAWVIGVPLYQLPFGVQWFIVLLAGGALLMLVLVAEYIVVDPEDARHAPATASLTAVSFALYLILAITLRSVGVRLLFILPALTLSACLVCLRTLHLRLHGRWVLLPTALLGLIVAQGTAALHYWPIPPTAFGLALLGPTYAITSLIGGLSEGIPVRQAIVEPAVVLFIVWGAALWIS